MHGYDDPSTFRGQLQRGRGIAFRRAQKHAQAGDAVYECVIDDPRWDRQAESRDTYLADLIRLLDLPLTPIEEHLAAFDDDDPDDVGLLLDVVAELVAAGHAEAVGVLRRYVRSGKHRSVALDALRHAGPMEAPDPEQHRAAAENRRRFLRTLAETPRDELLRQVALNTGRRYALEELGRRGDQIVLDLLEDPDLRNAADWIPGSVQALKHLGAAAVPRARRWISGDRTMTSLGLRVLAAQGDRRDVPGLISALELAFDDDDLWCAAEIPAEGLGRLQVAEVAPLLVAAWEQTVHSYARRRFLTALHSCAPQAAEPLADEGLDDCEPSVREVARSIRVR